MLAVAPPRATSRSPRGVGPDRSSCEGSPVPTALHEDHKLECDAQAFEEAATDGYYDVFEAKRYLQGGGSKPGGSLCKSALLGQIRLQNAYLHQVLNPGPPPPDASVTRVPELAAGVPLHAARAILLPESEPVAVSGGTITDFRQTFRRPWEGLPAHQACVAMSLRLFEELVPKSPRDNLLCHRFCIASSSSSTTNSTNVGTEIRSLTRARDELLESAASWGLTSRIVGSAAESLGAMVLGRPVVCCCLLEAYVAILQDPHTGEECEREVGAHCVLILGGDLAHSGGPSYVIIDPWVGEGAQDFGGDVAYWTSQEVLQASPFAWVELSPCI